MKLKKITADDIVDLMPACGPWRVIGTRIRNDEGECPACAVINLVQPTGVRVNPYMAASIAGFEWETNLIFNKVISAADFHQICTPALQARMLELCK